MRYFHRTSVPLDTVLEEADRYFGGRLNPGARGSHERTYGGSIGNVTVQVKAEGGHYTLVTLGTDQVGESELDKLAKRFLSKVHTLTHPEHEVRGAY